ncbi:acetyltransferase, GNAT family [Labilithrix luteola]|uniref:Acetyltransferase, GNAT family n=1 Tax=Labilithrix luteola TaxID=1391654 RepID=A0A0K1QEF2_9BACT|nr:GNAT family N-acetyltransferase [Labilithrix luteola]AKV04047.1 acetyltransferase, GNAT family [Labilithrix luteola]
MSAPRSARRSSPSSKRDVPFTGKPSWRVTRHLADGTAVTIRPILPDDREELKRAFLEASPQTRYLRFLGSVNELSDEMLTYLTNVDQKKHVALVATITSPDLKAERGVGVARFIVLDESPDVVDAAITVADDMQRKGIGSLLLRELERAARVRNIRTIRADVLADNARMRAILEAAGGKPSSTPTSEPPRIVAGVEDEYAGTISYDIELGPPAPSPNLLDVLRGAAQTMAVKFRRLLPPLTKSERKSDDPSDPTAPNEGEPESRDGEK